MKPMEFRQVNTIMGATQPEYQPLPAFQGPAPEFEVICAWKAEGWRERVRLALGGKVWVRLYTFGRPLQPVMVQVETPWPKVVQEPR